MPLLIRNGARAHVFGLVRVPFGLNFFQFFFNFVLSWGGVPKQNFSHFSSTFTIISAHTNFHDPRTTPSGGKVIRRRKGGKRKERGKKEEKNCEVRMLTIF
jgi:hypothetical protein